MAHSSTKIYVDTSGQRILGVSINDARVVLPDSSKDIGNLGQSVNVNKWAKWKPVRSDTFQSLSSSDMEDILYGLDITTFTSPSALAASYSGSGEYSYLYPRGVTSSIEEWFRFLDFDKYINNAECPVDDFTCVNSGSTVYEGTDLIARLYLNPSAPSGSIELSDLKPGGDKALSNYYFGVIIKNGNTYRIITQSTVVGNGSQSHQELALTLSSSLFSVGNDYTVYPVFSYNAITTIDSSSSFPAGLIAVPEVSPNSFHVYPVSLFVSVGITDFSMSVGAGRYNWSISAAMQVNGGTTTTGEILYRIYDGEYDPDFGTISGNVVDSGQFYYGQIAQAPSQTTYTKTGTVMGTIPTHLTAVLSYQGTDCLPVTIDTEDF